MSIPTHLTHQQPSLIAASTPSTTPNSSTTSTQVLSLQTLPAACPICSTYFSQPFVHYSIITPPSSPKPIIPLALLPLLGSPLKSSVLRPLSAIWNAPTSHHTQFSTLNCVGLLPTTTISLKPPQKSFYAALVQSSSSNPRALWKTINNILHRTANRSLPTSSPPAVLPQIFATYFSDKISKFHFNLQINPCSTPAHSIPPSPLLYSTLSHQPPYSKSTIYSFNHLIHTVISILFLPPY